jgi:hypothetical protein
MCFKTFRYILTHFYAFRLLGGWPNTYTYTKAIAEDTVRRLAGDLPVAVFRPSISKYQVIGKRTLKLLETEKYSSFCSVWI